MNWVITVGLLAMSPLLGGGTSLPQAPSTACQTTQVGDLPVDGVQNGVPFLTRHEFLYGSGTLFTKLRSDGRTNGVATNRGIREKIFWWSRDYNRVTEPIPALEVSGRRVDNSADTFIANGATNAHSDSLGLAMLVVVDFPSQGCWEVTAKYRGASLSYVTQVGP